MNRPNRTGRLSTLAAAFVIARRDFTAILFSRSFIFFLLGPLFPFVVGALAGGVGEQVKDSMERPVLGVAMSASDNAAMVAAQQRLVREVGETIPDMIVVRAIAPGEQFDPATAMRSNAANLAAIVSGSPGAPRLTGPSDRIENWQGRVALIAASAAGNGPKAFPGVELNSIATSRADQARSRLFTAQIGQTVLFLLMMLLAGMVLSNLVEEKSNKIIEVLAAAMPMDAVFLGKLFAMLAISLVGIAVWGSCAGLVLAFGGSALPTLPVPGVGWPMFVGLGVVYFAMGYLLLGSVFLAIGSLATSVREVQTLSMPVTMGQVLVFFFASLSVSSPGTVLEWAAIAFPFSSPFAMLARAAQYPDLWPHLLALAWQGLCVALFIRFGAGLFRRRVMQSGPQGVKTRRRLAFRR